MSKPEFLSAPRASKSKPLGIPYIVANEAAERFSFYGMKAVLLVYMTKFLCDQTGALSTMSDDNATAKVHYFVFAVYFFPVLGALISDVLLGKYRTILYLSIVYCLGHFVLAIGNHGLGISDRTGLFWGLLLIAFGAGGIKSCVSAHVGDQFGLQNKHLMSKVFGWFYFSINLGAFLSTLLTPWLLNSPYLIEREMNVHLAFGIPGILMAIATLFFWMGRNRFVHIPAKGAGMFREAFSGAGLKSILNLLMIYVFVAIFWSLFDQTASKWIVQSGHMNRTIFGHELLPSQIQAANPILILIFIPIFSGIIYPLLNRIFPLTPLRKISMGFFVTVIAFSISALIETRIDAGETPHIIWQLLAYAVLTAAEVMVSITCLEFSYTQAPKTMKSVIMAFYLLSVAAGNLLTALVNEFIQTIDPVTKKPVSLLEGASYYWFFAGLMFVAAVLFIGVSQLYRGKSYIQDDGDTLQVPETGDIYQSCPKCGQLNAVGVEACEKCGEMLALH